MKTRSVLPPETSPERWPGPEAVEGVRGTELWASAEAELAARIPVLAPGQRSPFELLLEAIEMHAANEADSLVAYRGLAETTPDPVIALLMRLVLEDEQRHHGLMQRLAASLHDGLYWTHSANALPDSTGPAPAASAEWKEWKRAVGRFVLEEREGAHDLQQLARQSARINEGLDSLLLEIMAMDSLKHERILRFIARRMEQAPGASSA